MIITRPSQLVLCGSCARHFRLHEPMCPFCGAEARGHTPLRTPLPAGASRAQRYAVRAALVASSASFGCSQSGDSTPDASPNDGTRQGDGSFTSGSGTGAGGASGAISSGGTTGGGGASGRDAGTAGRGGTGQADGGGGTSGNTGSACPGAVNPGGMTCRSSTDCTLPLSRCLLQAPLRCGNPTFAVRQCAMDMDCGAGMRCQFEACNATTCVANCTATSCGTAQNCVDGSCVAKRCDEPGAVACSQGWRCEPGAANATANGCAPVPCSPTDPCATNQDCAPTEVAVDPRGCAKRQCSLDGACDCGFCVAGLCEANLGFCFQEIAMPYDTVWPDEELV